MRTGRPKAFSDGVIAIAITLLILDIQVPDVRAGNLGQALVEQWPSYVAYAVTFLLIGIMRVDHHTLFDQLRTADRTLVFVNPVLCLGLHALVAGWYILPARRQRQAGLP